MSTLAERLAARPPRRTSVPIEVSDPGDAVRAAAGAARAQLAQVRMLRDLKSDGVTDEVLALAEAEAEQASAALAAHCEWVVLQAAPSEVWEQLLTEHLQDDGEDVDDDALPHMLALCAVDESLQTVEAWTATLPSLSYGDRLALRSAVLDVNSWTPVRGLGKG